jgi:hypothetical protein
MYYGAIITVSIVFSKGSDGDGVDDDDDDDDDDDTGGGYDIDYSAIFISSSAEVIGLAIAILAVDRFGRVPTIFWTYLLGGLCILVLGLFDYSIGGDNTVDGETSESPEQSEQEVERRHLIFFAFLSRMFIMSATSVTWLHTSELLPTEIRATGHGLGVSNAIFWFFYCALCMSIF